MTCCRVWAVTDVEGDVTRMRFEFENELEENMVQFARPGTIDVNFILCQFQRFVLFPQKEYSEFLF